MEVLIAPNMCHVYIAGNEFGATHYVIGENFSDAWEEYISALPDSEVCHHDEGVTDEQRWRNYCGDAEEGACDCEPDAIGRWISNIYLWMRQMRLPVDQFLLAFPEEDPR